MCFEMKRGACTLEKTTLLSLDTYRTTENQILLVKTQQFTPTNIDSIDDNVFTA